MVLFVCAILGVIVVTLVLGLAANTIRRPSPVVGSAGRERVPERDSGTAAHIRAGAARKGEEPRMNMNSAYQIGSEVIASDGPCGNLVRVIVNPVARTVTHLVLEPDRTPDNARLVPVALVDSGATTDTVRLSYDHAGFEALEYAQTEDYPRGEQDGLGYSADQTVRLPYFPYGGSVFAFPAPGPGNIGGEITPPAAAEPRVVTDVKDGIHLDLIKNDVRDLPELELGLDR
jgi:hypothetical protein